MSSRAMLASLLLFSIMLCESAFATVSFVEGSSTIYARVDVGSDASDEDPAGGPTPELISDLLDPSGNFNVATRDLAVFGSEGEGEAQATQSGGIQQLGGSVEEISGFVRVDARSGPAVPRAQAFGGSPGSVIVQASSELDVGFTVDSPTNFEISVDASTIADPEDFSNMFEVVFVGVGGGSVPVVIPPIPPEPDEFEVTQSGTLTPGSYTLLVRARTTRVASTTQLEHEGSRRIIATVRFGLEFSEPTPAATARWIDPSGGSFTESDNWELNQIPDGASDIALFDLPGEAYTVLFPASIENGKAVISGSDVRFDLGGNTYILKDGVDSGLVVEEIGTRLTIGNGNIDASELRVRDGFLQIENTTSIDRDVRVATQLDGGSPELVADGSFLDIGRDTFVGDPLQPGSEISLSPGRFVLRGGANMVAFGNLFVQHPLAQFIIEDEAIANFDGFAQLRGDVDVVSGGLRTGRLDIFNGGGLQLSATGTARTVGVARVETGLIETNEEGEEEILPGASVRDAASEWTVEQQLEIDGEGIVVVEAGGRLASDSLALREGRLDVGGAGSTVAVTQDVVLASDARAELNIQDGGQLQAGGPLTFGPELSFTEVTDAGSTLDAKMTTAANAVLVVAAGGSAAFESLAFGGDLIVDGTGSVLLSQGDLGLDPPGPLGLGLLVRNGGRAESARGIIRTDGRAEIDGDGSTWEVNSDGSLLVFGELTVCDGGRVIADGLVVLSTGRVTGDGGTVQLNQSPTGSGFINQGVLAIGNSPGSLTIEGDYVQQGGGVLEMEIGGFAPGVEHDRLVVTGDADFGGNLDLVFVDGFAPRTGDSFDVIAVDGATPSDFESVGIVNLAAGFEFELAAPPTGGGFTMTALNDGIFVPEPAAAMQAACALLVLALLRVRRRPTFARLLPALLVLLLPTADDARADGAHHGSADPLTEGWTIEPTDGSAFGSAIAPDPDFPGVSSWQVSGPGAGQRQRYKLVGPAAGTSWSLRARMRVADLSEPVDSGVMLEVANGGTRWLVMFGSNANGDTLMTFFGGGSYTLLAVQPLRTDYFLIEIAFDHVANEADVFVNGVEQESDWPGIAGAFSRVNFGDGTSAQGGRGRYEDVVFTSGVQACRDGVDNDGDGLVDFGGGDPDCASGNDPSEDDADHDDDGLLDGFEVANGFDPADPDENANGKVDGQDDSDADGLGNAAEQAAGTRPNDADSDGDGLVDGAELGNASFGAQQVITTAASFATSVFASDVDGDGDLDVLSSSLTDDKIAWYENTDGAGSFGLQQAITTAADGAFSAFAADLDGDGDMDALSASLFDSKVAWYENTDGAGNFGAQQVITATAGAASVFAADVDGDGDMDVLSASRFDDRIAWYENTDGAGNFGPQLVITTAAAGANEVFAADVDGDADLDVLSASDQDNKIAWYENIDGAGSFGAQQVITTTTNGARSVFASDVDGDGDLDVLSASFLDNKVAWYENIDGAGSFGAQQVITTAASSVQAVFASDVDGDGDADALSASSDEIAWYENTDGAGSFGVPQVITIAVDAPSSVRAEDVDGDGDLDVLSASEFDSKVAWYENENVSDPLDADSDDDGLLDGFEVANGFDLANPDENSNGKVDGQDDNDADGLGNAAEQLAGTDPNDSDSDDDGLFDGAELGSGSFGAPQVITTAADGAFSVFASDVDGDGDVDVLSASQFDDKLAWYENTDGAGSFGLQQVISLAADSPVSVIASDVDRDGDVDVLSASVFDDKIAWYQNTDGAGSFAPQQVITTAAGSASSVFAADVDHDGDLDVLSASPSDDKVAWYENTNGAGSFGPQQVITTAADFVLRVFAADVDGDGDVDVLSASNGDDTIAWHENTDGAGSFGTPQVITTAADSAYSVIASDVDGDGDADVLSASRFDDKIAWYENTDGAGSFGPQQVITTAADYATGVIASDVDGDGDVDVLSASQFDDKIAWYENTDGAGSFGAQQVITTLANGAISVFAADVDRDGDMDALSASLFDDKIAWYENQNVSDPLDPDSDADGLLDGAEVNTHGTDPLLFDTDGDGFSDAAEVALGSDPLDPFDFPTAASLPLLGGWGGALLVALLGAAGARALATKRAPTRRGLLRRSLRPETAGTPR